MPASSRERGIPGIPAWTNAPRSGDVTAAAKYFAIPSEFANADGRGRYGVAKIHTLRDAIAVNEPLSRGATFVSSSEHGGYLRVIFRLSGRRGGTSCNPGVGQDATTFFLVRHSEIVAWVRGPNVAQGTKGTPTVPPVTTNPGGGTPVA